MCTHTHLLGSSEFERWNARMHLQSAMAAALPCDPHTPQQGSSPERRPPSRSPPPCLPLMPHHLDAPRPATCARARDDAPRLRTSGRTDPKTDISQAAPTGAGPMPQPLAPIAGARIVSRPFRKGRGGNKEEGRWGLSFGIFDRGFGSDPGAGRLGSGPQQSRGWRCGRTSWLCSRTKTTSEPKHSCGHESQL